MKVLIIDNGTIRIDELEDLFIHDDTKTVTVSNISFVQTQEYDLIVLSGSSENPVLNNEGIYEKEIDLIRRSKKPIIGICLGFELICHVFGAELDVLSDRIHGIFEILAIPNKYVDLDLQKFKVYESHKWVVKELPSELIPLAVSAGGYEIIKHRNRQIWGLQFHPEMYLEETHGDEVLAVILNKIKA